jgi:chaperone modulatory protein CbpM
MITLEAVCATVAGLRPADVQRWIDNAWVRPEEQAGVWRFEAIDVARVRLIVELRDDMRVPEDSLPVVLSLLDQLHDTRRELQALRRAIAEVVRDEQREAMRQALQRSASRHD